jgi:hypothetical protein
LAKVRVPFQLINMILSQIWLTWFNWTSLENLSTVPRNSTKAEEVT